MSREFIPHTVNLDVAGIVIWL